MRNITPNDKNITCTKRFYPELSLNPDETSKAKFGYRPLSPDGMPYIGRSYFFKNLTIATGHAMIGWTLGPGTGKLVSELILNQKASVDLAPYNPNRTFG
ncbi:MAG: FAD-dependent oxidoreductase [Flavobacteriaceae bacterium]|nr:FAD-dependent oxidoreductase [Flavobacteriaceae bacterium]